MTAETTADAGAAASFCLGDTLQGSRAGYALIDTRAERFVVERDWTSSGVASIVGRHAMTSWSATIGLLLKGTEIISADIQSSDELMADARSYEAINVRAELAIPMMRQQQLMEFYLSTVRSLELGRRSKFHLRAQLQIAPTPR